MNGRLPIAWDIQRPHPHRLTASHEREHEHFLCWPIPIPRTCHQQDNMVYHNHSSLFTIEILEACALLPDMKILEVGEDMLRYASYDGWVMAKPFEGTEMGEKGVSLSGEPYMPEARYLYLLVPLWYHWCDISGDALRWPVSWPDLPDLSVSFLTTKVVWLQWICILHITSSTIVSV